MAVVPGVIQTFVPLPVLAVPGTFGPAANCAPPAPRLGAIVQVTFIELSAVRLKGALLESPTDQPTCVCTMSALRIPTVAVS